MRLVAIAQQLARQEASAHPAARPPRRLAARLAAPIVEQSDDPSDAADDDDDEDFSDPELLSRSASARGLQVWWQLLLNCLNGSIMLFQSCRNCFRTADS